MCFAPQRRALFLHLNFQKWSIRGVLCTFWLGNVLRATTACNFSSLIWPAGSAPAALTSLLFDPPEPQIIWKNTMFRDFPTFSRICIFFLLTLSLLPFSLLIFSLLSASALLCFSSVHIVGSLTSKLPSTIRQSQFYSGLIQIVRWSPEHRNLKVILICSNKDLTANTCKDSDPTNICRPGIRDWTKSEIAAKVRCFFLKGYMILPWNEPLKVRKGGKITRTQHEHDKL